MRYAATQWRAAFVGAAVTVFTFCAVASAAMAKAIELSFYYPIAVGGPIPKIIDGYVADFEKENPGIKIKAIYAGTYQDTLVKALTAFKSGEPPDIAVLLSTDMFTLIDEDAITPFDDLLKTDADKAWAKSFYPAFMENSRTGGKTSDGRLPTERLGASHSSARPSSCSRTRMPSRPPVSIRTRRRTPGTNWLLTGKNLSDATPPATSRNGQSKFPRPAFPIGCSRV